MAKNVKKKLIIVSIICAVIGIAILLGNLYKQYSFNACLKDETSPSRIEMWYGYLARNIGIDVKLAKQQIREQDIKDSLKCVCNITSDPFKTKYDSADLHSCMQKIIIPDNDFENCIANSVASVEYYTKKTRKQIEAQYGEKFFENFCTCFGKQKKEIYNTNTDSANISFLLKLKMKECIQYATTTK